MEPSYQFGVLYCVIVNNIVPTPEINKTLICISHYLGNRFKIRTYKHKYTHTRQYYGISMVY